MLLEFAIIAQVAGLAAFAAAYKGRDITLWLVSVALAGINAFGGGFFVEVMDTFGNVVVKTQGDVLAFNLIIAAFSVVMLFIDMFSEGLVTKTPKSLLSVKSWFSRTKRND